MNLLFNSQFWIAFFVGLLLIRHLFVVLAAEQGRKQDLVKKLYKANTDYNLSILIPYLSHHRVYQLQELLKAISEQEYPAAKITVHVVTSNDKTSELETEALPENVKLWKFPRPNPVQGEATYWLIERLLAAGGSGIFIFLNPEDIIKPDFFHNVVARSFDSSIIQGYVAMRYRPDTLLAKLLSLSLRLFNRVENAGRYHLGLSCKLQDSGWAVKREVLEMIPYRRGRDLDNTEYTLRLNLENYRVVWAPNVVVYSGKEPTLLPYLVEYIAGFFNRLELISRYGLRLLLRGIFSFDYSFLEHFLELVKPPTFVLGLLILALWLSTPASKAVGSIPSPVWIVLTASLVIVYFLSVFVARCKPSDYLFTLWGTPSVYALSFLASPLAFAQYIGSLFSRRRPINERDYRQMVNTRFNEAMEPTPDFMTTQPKSYGSLPLKNLETARPATAEELLSSSRVTLPGAAETLKRPRERVQSVPLSNGNNQIECLLKTKTTYNAEGEEIYQMVLEYKSVAFSTSTYRILDQAYYELYAKLKERGLTIMTCGSCGNFYNPMADVPGTVKNAGVCLFGKQGKEVNLEIDAVTVISQACPYHCSIESREAIVRDWRESLFPASPL